PEAGGRTGACSPGAVTARPAVAGAAPASSLKRENISFAPGGLAARYSRRSFPIRKDLSGHQSQRQEMSQYSSARMNRRWLHRSRQVLMLVEEPPEAPAKEPC